MGDKDDHNYKHFLLESTGIPQPFRSMKSFD